VFGQLMICAVIVPPQSTALSDGSVNISVVRARFEILCECGRGSHDNGDSVSEILHHLWTHVRHAALVELWHDTGDSTSGIL
jgi:hypothetical protein